MLETHEQVLDMKHLPHVGEIVRSKKFGTLWRVMEEKEIWQNIEDDVATGEPRTIPAIRIAYWKINKEITPGTGKMLEYTYTLHDNTFEVNWEIQ